MAHPFLTRGRHYRFRVCGDVFLKDSFTIIHGSHQFFKNPNKVQPFRLIDSVVRNGEVVMTVPNYDLDMGSDDEVKIGTGDAKTSSSGAPTAWWRKCISSAAAQPSTDRTYFAASYAGYGTSLLVCAGSGFLAAAGQDRLDRRQSSVPGRGG